MSRARNLANLGNKNTLTGINTSGRVGIGSTAPAGTIDVFGDDGYAYFTTTSPQAFNMIFRSGSADPQNNWLGQIEFTGQPGSTSQIVTRISRSLALGSNNEHVRITRAGNVGINKAVPNVTFDIEGEDAIRIPRGTTAQRPSGAAGQFRNNTTTGNFEGYTSEWGAIAGSGGGGSSSFAKDTFTGDGSTTAFTMSTNMSTENGLIVFIDGVYQADNVYSVSGTTLTFACLLYTSPSPRD